MSLMTSSRVWSCATLKDGIDHLVAEANKIESEEDSLERLIKDRYIVSFPLFLIPIFM